jgi:hypothetical protein
MGIKNKKQLGYGFQGTITSKILMIAKYYKSMIAFAIMNSVEFLTFK